VDKFAIGLNLQFALMLACIVCNLKENAAIAIGLSLQLLWAL
jgi:hypothetical protein